MPEIETLDVTDRNVYNPTHEYIRLLSVGNFHFLCSRVAAAHYILELRTVLNSHGVGEQAV